MVEYGDALPFQRRTIGTIASPINPAAITVMKVSGS